MCFEEAEKGGCKNRNCFNEVQIQDRGYIKKDKLLQYFDVIVAGRCCGHKPDPEGLLKAISMVGCQKEEVLFVGDSTVDARTAKNAGVDFVAFLRGQPGQMSFQSIILVL